MMNELGKGAFALTTEKGATAAAHHVLMLTAWHEVGHVVAALALEGDLASTRVESLDDGRRVRGRTVISNFNALSDDRRLVIIRAGVASENRVCCMLGLPPAGFSGTDSTLYDSIIGRGDPFQERFNADFFKNIFTAVRDEADDLIETDGVLVDALAAQLLSSDYSVGAGSGDVHYILTVGDVLDVLAERRASIVNDDLKVLAAARYRALLSEHEAKAAAR